jgi:hypothetical protein
MGRVTRKRSRDLFPTDGPVAGNRLIGREGDVADLVRALGNGIHRVVAGPRRTGKTSVCRAVLGRLRRRGLYVVELDLFRIPNRAELAEALVIESVGNRPALRRAAARARRAGRAALVGATLTASTRLKTELGDEVELAFRPGIAGRDPDRYLAFALGLPQRIAVADDRQLVLFIDEFQEIAGERAPYGDPDALTKQMRSILQDSDRVTCLFAGSLEHLMRDLFTPRHRALYQFGGFHSLGPIDVDDWQVGLTRRFAEDGCTVDGDALAQLIEMGEGHPRATMLVAQQTHDAAVADGTHRVDSGLVAVGLASAMAADRASHELITERIRSLGRHTFVVARRVAQAQRAYPGLEPKAANRALHALRDVGLIEQHARGEWHVSDPLLRRYLSDL